MDDQHEDRADAAREREELLAGHALDALDSEQEREDARRLIAQDPEAAALAAEWSEVAAQLAGAEAVRPPEQLRAAVLAAAARTEQEGAARTEAAARTAQEGAAPEPSVAEPLGGPHRFRRRTAMLLAAAAAVVAIAIPTGVAVQQHHRASEAVAQQQQLEDMLRDPGAQVSSAKLSTGGTLSVLRADGRGVVLTAGLAELPQDRTYQLWTIEGDGSPVSAGLAGRGGDSSTPTGALAAGTTVAVTVEPAAGSTAPTTTPLATVTS